MIERILPGTVIAVEAGDDDRPVDLFPAEEAMMARAVERRRREFATGRDCAHRALQRLRAPAGPVLSGNSGEPVWPAGVVGSIAHCRGYRGCAVAAATDLAAIGIDAEPHELLPEGLIEKVAGGEEKGALAMLTRAEPTIAWDRLLFSAKEALYKAWYPLAERWLGFEDAVLTIDRRERTFAARLLVPGPIVGGAELTGFEGRWLVEDGLVLTAVAVSS
ncbi:MAG: putative phosphopantetheinyl transferase PptA [Solirubrobacterales bacterium]|nr:putative phosphopantetheinyl transferase PptA [Solirubrobacterales bacterium]